MQLFLILQKKMKTLILKSKLLNLLSLMFINSILHNFQCLHNFTNNNKVLLLELKKKLMLYFLYTYLSNFDITMQIVSLLD